MMPETTTAVRPTLGLRGYLSIFRRRRWVIIVVTLIVFAAGTYRSVNQTKEYEASGQIVIQSDSAQPAAVSTEAKIVESPAVHALALKTNPDIGTVSTTTNVNDNVITVIADDADPNVAADTVNGHMQAYIDYTHNTQAARYTAAVGALQPKIDALQTQITALTPAAVNSPTVGAQVSNLTNQMQTLQSRLLSLSVDTTLAGDNVTIVAPATPPSSAIRPQPKQDALLALGAGLLLGIALAFLLEFLDDSIKNREDLQLATGPEVSLLGLIPSVRPAKGAEIISIVAPKSVAAEAYRSLRTAVYFMGLERGSCFEITSPRSEEGKTTTSANLAVAAARAGKKVILVDCDLRRPSVHSIFGLPNDAGFTSVLLGEALANVVQKVPEVDNLFVLTSGPLPPNPSELLTSTRGHEVLEMLHDQDALVLIDTPPLLGLTDAAALAASVDAVMLVTRAGYSTRRSCRNALDLLAQVGAPVLGTILTRCKEDESIGSYTERLTHRRRRAVLPEPEASQQRAGSSY